MALQAACSAVLPERSFQWFEGDIGPRSEARGLVALVRATGESVESVRQLIDIPPSVERVLRYYMRQYPEDAVGVEKVLRFRKNVRKEFDRLIQEKILPSESSALPLCSLIASDCLL